MIDLIRYYTKEAGAQFGTRDRQNCAESRERAVLDADGKKKGRSKRRKASQTFANTTVGSDQLSHYSGVRKFSYGRAEEKDQVGIVTGLAWTQVGGELLNIEAVSMPGKGRRRNRLLGDVMQESIQAALVRSRAGVLGLPSFHDKTDLHIHVPEGATPKDGPSAGIGRTAMVSDYRHTSQGRCCDDRRDYLRGHVADWGLEGKTARSTSRWCQAGNYSA